ncbi:hypothetical protein F2Q69_00017906 [Brassica cretica]|uniref:Uncharacterized protein n=1 Tax=Brassica cretica TaxID=69181 RepID=A0A8S9QVI5_BRACR|nr:hypothetical protein F2Q69_00017906 [Brassica cretica]
MASPPTCLCLPPQKNDQNPSQSTTLSVITASCPLVLVFSDVRRLYQSSRRLLLRRAMSSVWRSASAGGDAKIWFSGGTAKSTTVCADEDHRRFSLELQN